MRGRESERERRKKRGRERQRVKEEENGEEREKRERQSGTSQTLSHQIGRKKNRRKGILGHLPEYKI